MTISAIIPVYNGEHHVRAALASVLAQTVAPTELIFVDDGSTDGSGALLADLAAEHPMVRVLSIANSGQSAARNAAVSLASGELLAFLDQDDLWRPQHLEMLAAPFVSDSELGWCYSDFDEIDDEGHIVTRRFMRAAGVGTEPFSVGEIIHRDAMVLPSASILRRRAFEAVGGFDPSLQGYEDDDLFLRVFRAGWGARFVDAPLTAFRIHPGSSSTRGTFRRSRMRFFAKVSELFPDDPRLNRYYVTDALRPRMVASTLFDYSVALWFRQDAEARSIVIDLETLLGEHMSPRHGFALWVMRRPHWARALLVARGRLPRRLRPRVPSILTRERPVARA